MRNVKLTCTRFTKTGIIFIVVLFSSSAIYGLGKENENSGQITYKIEYEDLSFKYFLFQAMLPDETISHFTSDQYRQKTLSSFLILTVYADSKNRTVSLVTNIDGSIFQLIQSFEEYQKQINLELHNKYKTIHGYHCRRATYTERGKEVEVYYTTDLKVNEPVLLANDIQGCILEKVSRLKNDGGVSIMRVNNIQFKSISDNDFFIPTDAKTYTNITDFEKAIDEMD